MSVSQNAIFEDLFVLELANNHLGNVGRGLKIINDFGKIVRFNNVRAAIKFQFRDVDHLIHERYRNRSDIRYIKKTLATKLTDDEYGVLVDAVRRNSLITMATPFDERSVDLCVQLSIDIIKLASSDINDWFLIEKILKTRKPVIASSGGSSVKDTDDLVTVFDKRNIPLAINHCVSLYPSEDHELEMNQIDFLKNRYPNTIIGFSTHEYNDWTNSMLISYAKGARTWERHIDIEMDGIPVSPYCSLPHQIDQWFKAYHKARQMCGTSGQEKRIVPLREIEYLDQTVRGMYARIDLPPGHILKEGDVFLAVPLLKGQVSCREFMTGETLIKGVKQNDPLFIETIESPYAHRDDLKQHIYKRGIDPNPLIVNIELKNENLLSLKKHRGRPTKIKS